MSDQIFDLMGDPIPEPLAVNEHLTQIAQLVGHTIKAAIEAPNGRHHADLLIVTETNCWAGFVGETDGCGDDSANATIIGRRYGCASLSLCDYASASELKAHNCITHSEYVYLKGLEDKRKKEENAERAAWLHAQAEKLEKEIGASHD
jgi:hypothetical protein